MDRILFDLGVGDSWVRRRLTAHAIVASGWKQNVWHFNAWGVQRGKSWAGDFYVMGTKEIEDGAEVYHASQEWRAFESWEAALDDTLARAKANAGRWATLHDASAPDGDYWAATKAAGYFTAALDVSFFESICRRVSKEIGAEPTEKKKL
jgi:flagellum-specific peptidoglycan hydrolase FlgJ